MKTGSICTGCMGLDLGLEALGAQIIWQAETDSACCKVLDRHSTAPNLGDIKTVDWSTVEPVELLAAGPPCQPISTAGKRKGTQDERWLWPIVLDAVRILRPRLVFLENPTGLRPWLGDLLAELAALGFDAEWDVFRASDVGAPHRRDRFFILASHPDRNSEEVESELQAPRRGNLARPDITSPDPDGLRSYGGGVTR